MAKLVAFGLALVTTWTWVGTALPTPSALPAPCGLERDTLEFQADWAGSSDTLYAVYRSTSCSNFDLYPSPDVPWVEAVAPTNTPISPGTSFNMRFSVSPTGLAPGVHRGRIVWYQSGGGQTHVDLVFTVDPAPAQISGLPASIVLEQRAGATPSHSSLLIKNEGHDPLVLEITEGAGWMRPGIRNLTVGSGATQSLLLRIEPPDAPGLFSDALRIVTNDLARPIITIPVTLTVHPSAEEVVPDEFGIEEFATLCSNASGAAQFIELKALGDKATYDPLIGLRIENSHGITTSDTRNLFTPRTPGGAWSHGSSWLLGTPGFASGGFAAPDRILNVVLDPKGGVLTLYRDSPGSLVLQRLSYGARGRRDPPGPGRSLAMTQGDYLESGLPNPRNSAGQESQGFDCTCPSSFVGAGVFGHATSAPSDRETDTTRGYAISEYDVPAATFEIFANGSSAGIDLREVFIVEGLPVGIPTTFEARIHVLGSCDASSGPFGLVHFGRFSASGGIEGVPGFSIRGRTLYQEYGSQCSLTRVFSFPVTRSVLDPFVLEIDAQCDGSFHVQPGGSGGVSGRFEFLNLPPGVRIRSCRGFQQEMPTPLGVSIAASERTDEGIRIRWSGLPPRRVVAIERRGEDSDWAGHARTVSDGEGGIDFRDDDVDASRGYGYRLNSESGPAGELWMEAVSHSAPGMATAHYERSSGRIVLRLALNGTLPEEIQVFDVAGRFLEPLVLPAGATPGQSIQFDASRFRSGIYFLRFRSAIGSTVKRLALVR